MAHSTSAPLDQPPLTALHKLRHLPFVLHRAFEHALADDVNNIAQSAAYSAIGALFPALIAAAAVVPLLPSLQPVREEVAAVLQRVLPTDVTPLLDSYFTPSHERVASTRVLLVGLLFATVGASGVIATFMEGLRRAYRLPANCWNFWTRRLRALALVPLSLLPLAASSLLVLFGHLLALRLFGEDLDGRGRTVIAAAFLLRWIFAVGSSVGLIALLYKLGTPLRLSWRSTLPGAVLSTALWFVSTLSFGWYVTRFANYSRVYGSLGAGIALLFWLYLTSLSVLCGAEFNAQLATERAVRRSSGETSAGSF